MTTPHRLAALVALALFGAACGSSQDSVIAASPDPEQPASAEPTVNGDGGEASAEATAVEPAPCSVDLLNVPAGWEVTGVDVRACEPNFGRSQRNSSTFYLADDFFSAISVDLQPGVDLSFEDSNEVVAGLSANLIRPDETAETGLAFLAIPTSEGTLTVRSIGISREELLAVGELVLPAITSNEPLPQTAGGLRTVGTVSSASLGIPALAQWELATGDAEPAQLFAIASDGAASPAGADMVLGGAEPVRDEAGVVVGFASSEPGPFGFGPLAGVILPDGLFLSAVGLEFDQLSQLSATAVSIPE